MLDERRLGEFIGQRFCAAGDTLFRMETLPAYAVAADGEDYCRWLAGEPEPTWSRKQPWLDALRREREGGRVSRRIRVLTAELTAYERYSCEFGYAFNSEAGEDIRVLRAGEHAAPEGLGGPDFWIINDDTSVVMHYDADGRFLGAEPVPDDLAEFRRLRDAAWSVAEPFTRWWARHPELRRS